MRTSQNDLIAPLECPYFATITRTHVHRRARAHTHAHPLRRFPGSRHSFYLGSAQQQRYGGSSADRTAPCVSEIQPGTCGPTEQRGRWMVQGTLRHSGHRGDKTSLSDISKSVVIYSKVVAGNLSQWIHPSALPGLPRTSGTIVSSSRNTSRSEATLISFFFLLLSFVFTVFSPQVLLPPQRSGRQTSAIVLSPDVAGGVIF